MLEAGSLETSLGAAKIARSSGDFQPPVEVTPAPTSLSFGCSGDAGKVFMKTLSPQARYSAVLL